MTVEELIEQLKQIDPDAEVLVSDEEGNYFNPLSNVSEEQAIKQSGWEWDIFDPDDLDEYLEDCKEDNVEPENVTVAWIF